MKTFGTGRGIVLLLAALAMAAVVGCESEPTAPHDDLPALTQQEVAVQAALLSLGFAQLIDEFYDFLDSKNLYTHPVDAGNVQGEMSLDFQCDGLPCPKNDPDADYLRIFTDSEQSIELIWDPELPPLIRLTFGLEVDPYDNTPGAEGGLFNGGGHLDLIDYGSSFSVDGVELSRGEYPGEGALTYEAGAHTAIVTFDGTALANLAIGGDNYQVNLNTGELVE